jgi:hypothetical protein
MKKLTTLLLVALLALSLVACGKVKLHCDGCGKEIYCDSKMDESWIVFCADCEPDLELD